MPLTRKAAALSLGLFGILTAATIAQPPQRSNGGDSEKLVVEDASVDWFQKSDIAALREGVIDKLELRIGKEVGPPIDGQGAVIGTLHRENAELAVAEAKIQAESRGAVLKAEAQKKHAASVIQRNNELNRKNSNYVSREEAQKAEAEFLIADASYIEAEDTQRLAQAKLKTAQRVADEHVIRAPFAGIIIEEFKHEGERVNANESVVRIGNLDRVRVWAFIPIEYAYRVALGTDIEIQPRLTEGTRTGKHPIEQKKFRGKVTFVDPSLQTIAENGVKVFAEIDNPKHELRPNLKATMTFYLKPETTVPLNPGGAPPANLGARPLDLPTLPR